jgi:uncharacterized membrane protein
MAVDPVAPAEPAAPRGLLALNAWLGRHWVSVLTLASGLFIALPLLAPVLAMAGQERLSASIYFTYRITCHQLPQRSWFVGGEVATHDWEEIRPYVARPKAGPLMAFHAPLGNPTLGYQVGFCQRDTAIYLAVFLTCLAYGPLRRRRDVRTMPLWLYALMALPMALDGLTQLLGLRESTPLLRTVTGALFGAGSAWLILTFLEASFREAAAYAAPPGAPGSQRPT